MTRRRLPVLLPLALVLGPLLGGCAQHVNRDPGAQPGEEGVRVVISTYAQALADGEAAQACAVMSAAAQEALVARAGSGNCLTAVTAIADGLPGDVADALTQVEVSDVTGEESESTAAAVVALPGSGGEEAMAVLGGPEIRLVRVDARWSIDSTVS